MQFALIENRRELPTPGARGNCPMCGSPMIAKCGPRILHHWAHRGQRNCDPWWENETEWHRAWKDLFPEACREISHVAPDGEVHRADIKTPTGIVIEIQHSSMPDSERLSREVFYENLVWVLDGTTFKDNFDLYHQLPDPASELAKDIVWSKAKRGLLGTTSGTFYRRSENEPGATMVLVHSIREIQDEITNNWRGHRQYDWVRPRNTWLDATCPVYIDFGNEYLVKLEEYGESQMPCVRMVSKLKFVHDVMVKQLATEVTVDFSVDIQS